MKKLLYLLITAIIALTLSFGLVSCGDDTPEEDKPSDNGGNPFEGGGIETPIIPLT